MSLHTGGPAWGTGDKGSKCPVRRTIRSRTPGWFQQRAAPGRPVSSRGHKARRGSPTAHRPFGKVGVHPKWDREWGQLKAQSSGGFRFPAGAAQLPAPERRAGGGRPQPRGRKLRASPHRPRTHPPPPPPSPLPPAGPARSRSPCRAGPVPARSPEARRVPGGCRRRAPRAPRDAAPSPSAAIGHCDPLSVLPLV
ncbi:proline-rich proteoglycan 2-like [Manis pentadactyla]|uniref:proline-rich proteoglycan 2-like n=1 Tax=Manis pentadactyla TaxID=143292 RepID=UPI00255CFAFC|nr:proline-rich proteoglycan 2-like [Manis pentadactyla]